MQYNNKIIQYKIDQKNINFAIIKINDLKPPILFVVDKNIYFIGTITDGHIRRHI